MFVPHAMTAPLSDATKCSRAPWSCSLDARRLYGYTSPTPKGLKILRSATVASGHAVWRGSLLLRATIVCAIAIAFVILATVARSATVRVFAGVFPVIAIAVWYVLREVRVAQKLVVEIELPHAIWPSQACPTLLQALEKIPALRRDPAPTCDVLRLTASGVVYGISFDVADRSDAAQIRSRVLTRTWHVMQREHYFAHEPQSASRVATALSALDATPLFVSVPTDVKEEMSRAAEVQLWQRGERIFEQGADADACFIVSKGSLGVYVAEEGAEIHVATLQPGDLFGEMSLLTGGTRLATVSAEEDSELVRIEMSSLHSMLSRFPNLVQLLVETVAARRDELELAVQSLSSRAPKPAANPVVANVSGPSFPS